MIEINGWAVIRESYKEEEDDDNELLNSIIKQIESKINELDYSNEFYSLKRLNGTYHLSIMVNHNHRTVTEHVIDFFKWLALISKGSYGIMYVQDDEDIERGNEDKFKVWSMKKGKVAELDDIYLSPLNPEIEE
ncbi:Imm7 family immunity protein [Winogradskyella arenosi]|uniref:Immunity protein 7 of polymorphic toxin system n=1 Tax=Winogradskyella arenosi TaxID=533325 RepID=A0A368ZAR9_9FLAO|nr:Imm7 family immunity protein [Winogradskyella arenosi]RCW89822.1 immunity protein 7 of polymorphic toxin system [Winogradskyella arenosi]